MTVSRTTLAAVATAMTLASTYLLGQAQASPVSTDPPGPERLGGTTTLTNLDHLDFLGDTAAPQILARHTTYRLGRQHTVGTLWTYAERGEDGTDTRVGGGKYDPATDTYEQGAFNADDMSRAAVVYLRHWQATRERSSRRAAYEMLRGLTYLQTTSGRYAGNVVLWMQPDGTLNRSAEPVELPDPSDSDASYWLARTIWALGEGYAAFRGDAPRFAAFLQRRLQLAVDAVDRQVLDRYGEYLVIDGRRAPAWLIVDGADATAEAMLGLAAYVEAGGSPAARRALIRLGAGVAALSGGSARRWPFGAIRPWALSRSVFHSWASQMPAALARASLALGRPGLAGAATLDSFTFDPWLLTSGGPDQGRLPTRTDTVQIAYGVDSRVQSLVATADATRRTAALRLAGIVASWYFGANPAGEQMYDPATGRTYDGIDPDGAINLNSGAESTIHGLLSMLVLDTHPRADRYARTDTIDERRGPRTLEAEEASLGAGTRIVTPASVSTGEASYSGTGHVALGAGERATFGLPPHRRSLVLAVVDRQPRSNAVTTFAAGSRELGRVRAGAIGAQGASPAPGALLPSTLERVLPAGTARLRALTLAGRTAPARLDAVVLQPLVSQLVLRGGGHSTALLSSASTDRERARVQVPGRGRARVTAYNGAGRLVNARRTRASTVTVTVPGGGFVLVRR